MAAPSIHGHNYPTHSYVHGDGGSRWVSSDETYSELLEAGDHPVAVATRASLDRELNAPACYSGHHGDVHGHALHVAWCLAHPENQTARWSLDFMTKALARAKEASC